MSIEDANMVCIFPIFAWNFQILFQYFTNLLISFLFFFSITVQIHHTFSKYMYFKIHYAWCKIRYLATLRKYWYKLEGYSVELRKKAIFFFIKRLDLLLINFKCGWFRICLIHIWIRESRNRSIKRRKTKWCEETVLKKIPPNGSVSRSIFWSIRYPFGHFVA